MITARAPFCRAIQRYHRWILLPAEGTVGGWVDHRGMTITDTAGTPRRVHGAGICGDLTRESVIPRGQRCSQALRVYFVSELGRGFHFDAPMRKFIATNAGRTLGAAVDFWAGSRDLPPAEIGAQFELNRFQRSWHATHPGAGHGDLLAAWKVYRSLPVHARPDVNNFQAVRPAAAASQADAKS